MADKNEYKTVLKISAEGDAQGVDAFTESLKRLKGEAQGSNSELAKASAQAKDAASGMAKAADSTERLGGAQDAAAEKSSGWFSKTRKGLESVSQGVGMLNRLVTGFGLINVISNAIHLFKELRSCIDAVAEAASQARTEMAKLDIADMARQTGALADAQERAADAAARQFESINKISDAKAAEQDAGFAADLAELDAEEQRALADSLANDPANEAGRTALSADFASRRRKLQRGRELSAKKSALDQASSGTADAKRTAAGRERDVGETATSLEEVRLRIAAQLARAEAALDPATAPMKTTTIPSEGGPVSPLSVIDVAERDRIIAEVKELLDGDKGLNNLRDTLADRLATQKAAAESAAANVPAAESAERKARIEYSSAEKDSSRRDAALDAMDALKAQEALRRQSAQFSKDQASPRWDDVREADRKAADAALPSLYRQKGAVDSEKITLESRERDARDSLVRLRAGEEEARWNARQSLSDTSKTPRERRTESDAFTRQANAFAADAKRTEAALETIEASFRSVAEKAERVAARIRQIEQRSTAGSADVFQP